MKIAAIGAAGNVGQRLVKEAMSRGHAVTAIGPNERKLAELGATGSAVGDITKPEPLSRLLAGHDVIVSAVRFTLYQPEMLLDAARRSAVPRLAIVGGAGSLRSPAGTLVPCASAAAAMR